MKESIATYSTLNQVRLQVKRSLIDLTNPKASIFDHSSPVIASVIESTPQGPEVGSLVLAPGIHAKECNVLATSCLILENETEENLALLAGISVPAFVALRRVNFEIGAQVIVIGLDLSGLILVSICRLAGAGMISALDMRESQRNHAESLGARRVVSPAEKAWAEALIQGSSRGGADVVFATTTTPGLVEAILPYCRKEARILLLNSMSTIPLDLYHHVHTSGRTILGALPLTNPEAQWTLDASRLLRLLNVGRYQAKSLIGQSFDLSLILTQGDRLWEKDFSDTPTVIINWEN